MAQIRLEWSHRGMFQQWRFFLSFPPPFHFPPLPCVLFVICHIIEFVLLSLHWFTVKNKIKLKTLFRGNEKLGSPVTEISYWYISCFWKKKVNPCGDSTSKAGQTLTVTPQAVGTCRRPLGDSSLCSHIRPLALTTILNEEEEPDWLINWLL